MIAGTPDYLLAAYFDQKLDVVEKFPKQDVFIAPR